MTTPVAVAQRSGQWLADPGFGVYVHIPFCRHRCHYCDFNTYEGLDALHRPYVDAVVADIERTSGDFPEATSVFFGGGTPTLLPAGDLARILGAVRDRVGIAPDAEVTVEANPETVDEAYFEGLLGAGFNRVSIGIQSLMPHVLEGLGRTHSYSKALEAISAARSAGVDDLNADLIYGSVWETPDDWMRSLEGIVGAGPDHISAYALTVEEGTPLDTMVRTGRVPDVDPDVQAERHAVADAVLSAAGYHRYEVSNWAKPGRASRHNVLYWSAGEYLAFGAGAHGHLAGRRYWNVRLPRDFVDAVVSGSSTESGHEIVEDHRAEALMLGLRLASGICVPDFEDHFGSLAERRPIIEALLAEGSLAEDDGWLQIPGDRTMVANDIISRLI
ncbi:MAG: radical SAM family heme chaperone HemW [Actinomycetota bacterium]